MIQIYDLLNIQTMSMETWIRVLEYKVPISQNINLFIDDVALKRTPENSMSERLKAAILESKSEETEEQKLNKARQKEERKSERRMEQQ